MQNKNEESNIPEENSLCVWGDNSFGQLAFENANNGHKVFIPKMLNFGIHIVEISCGFEHSLLRSIKGELYSVGNNKKGQLGIGIKIKNRTAPVMVNFEDENEKILLASTQGYHNIAYTEFGNIFVWGDNSSGQLGTGDLEMRDLPEAITERLILEPDHSIITISCGREHSVVVLNTLICISWGSNEFYQLGIDVETNENILTPTETMIQNIKGVAAGYEHTLFLENDGILFVTGNNQNERLISGNKALEIKVPTKLEFEEPIKRVYASNMNCVITENLNLWIWGCFMDQILPLFNPFDENEDTDLFKISSKSGNEQLGKPNEQLWKHNNQNKSTNKPKIDIAGVGENFLIAADEFGDCFCWGYNGNAELGQALENQNDKSKFIAFPKKLEILSTFEVKSIYAGRNFVFTIIFERLTDQELAGENMIQYDAKSDNYYKHIPDLESDNYQSDISKQNFASNERVNKLNTRSIGEQQNLESNRMESQTDENYQNESLEDIKLQMDGHAIDVVRVIVFLYESLRFNLIKIIDETINVDQALPPELVELIKKLQDVIDDYITRCNLKVELQVPIDDENVMELKYPEGLKFMEDFPKDADYKKDSFNETKTANDILTKEQSKLRKIKTETLLKLAQLDNMITARIPELKKIVKMR